jgi:hypothetical protein
MGSAPADAAPTVGDIRNIVLRVLLLAGGLYLMVDSISRIMKLLLKK